MPCPLCVAALVPGEMTRRSFPFRACLAAASRPQVYLISVLDRAVFVTTIFEGRLRETNGDGVVHHRVQVSDALTEHPGKYGLAIRNASPGPTSINTVISIAV